MPKLKWGENNTDWDELPEDWEDSDFEPYTGPTPPSKAILRGEITKIWATESSNGNAMLKVLFVVADKGDKKKFNGCPIWENVTFTPSTAFRYGPFLELLGVTLADVRKRVITAEEEDNVGTPVLKIGKTKLPVQARVLVKRERYDGEPQPRVGSWLPANATDTGRADGDADDEDDEDDDDPF